MDNVRRLPAGYRRDTPSISVRDSRPPRMLEFGSGSNASHNVTQRRSPYFTPSAPLEAGLFDSRSSPEVERPLDDFDRALLDEGRRVPGPAGRLGLTRFSLPLKPLTPLMTSRTGRFSQDDSHDNSNLQASSSSPTALTTSPTVSFLQSRQRDRTNSSLPSRIFDSRPNNFPPEAAGPSSIMTTGNMRGSRISSLGNRPTSTLPVVQGVQLLPATILPDQMRSVFKFEVFNAVQAKCFESAFQSDDNLVVSAPTGSGKTAIMELAICRLVAESKGRDFKVVYQSPTKSLCSERYRDWQTKFGALNLHCAELTGDSDHNDLANAQKANIIITTPEKWDSVTRKWKDHAKLMQLVKLFLVDEVHILKDERGATLEAVVSRMKSVKSNIRLVALSATVPNSEDVATWLGKNSSSQHLPARREVFGESFRPVELKKHVYGFEAKSNDFAFDSMLTHQIPEIIAKHGQGKPVMVFCSTRRAAATLAKMLADMWSTSRPSERLWRGPEKPLLLTSSDLKATAVAGVAFHHGGVLASDRHTIENAFLDGQINVICSTSTLAVGVNLPCYLVILKGTVSWSNNGFKEYADLEVMQMLGRAGRPQFETSACAVILTRKNKVAHYRKMVSGEKMLESCLHQNLIEHLNAEVVLGTVHDVASAKQWLESTFFYVRLKKNPSHYQFREGVEESTEDELLERLCNKDVGLLLDAGLVEYSTRLNSTVFGEAMARYYVSFDTMKSFMGLPPRARMSEILSVLAQAREFSEVRMLAGEKSFYKEINKAPEIKFPVKVDVALPCHKILLLIQAELGNVALPDGETHKKHHHQCRIDKTPVFAHANRLIRCIIDCQIHREDGTSTRNALELGRSLAARVWDNTASQLRQVEGLGEVAVRKLAAAHINSIDTLLNTEPSRIEMVLAKNPPFGHQLLQKLESFPDLRISVKETGREVAAGGGANIRIVAELGFLNKQLPRTFNKKTFSICFLAETSHGALVDFRRFNPKKLEGDEQVCLTLHLSRPTSHVNCYVMCDNIAGTSKYAQLNLSDIPKLVEEFDDGGINDQDLLDVEADVAPYREPTQLRNGRWTCQHDCNEQNKKCKHRCCREGVAKPRRRPKVEPKIQEDKVQKKITAVMKPNVKPEGEDHTQSAELTAEKWQSKPNQNKAKISSRTGRSRSRSPGVTNVKRPAAKRVKLSPGRGRKDSDQLDTDTNFKPEDSWQSFHNSQSDVLKGHNSSTGKDIDDFLALFSDDDDDDPINFSLGKTGSIDQHDCSSRKSTEVVGATNPLSTGLGGEDWLPREEEHMDFSTADVDLGCFDAPLEHVSLSDVLKKSKTSATIQDSFSPPELPDLADDANFHDDFFLATVDFDQCPTNHPGKIADSASRRNEDVTSIADTPVESVVKTPEGAELMDRPVETGDGITEPAGKETNSQREKRLYEEDQEKKWEGIDQWVYDEFHEYVELV